MATIKYNGMELEEVTAPQIFDPPRECLVWDENPRPYYTLPVSAIGRTKHGLRVLSDEGTTWRHCALLPDSPKPRRATWLEVARWCATGNGLVYDTDRDKIDTGIMFKPSNEREPIMDGIKVRKWSDTEWHEPTVDYMGLDDDHYNFNKKYKGE